MVSNTFLQKKELSFLEKWLILELGQEICKMSWEYLIPESKGGKPYIDGDNPRGQKVQLKRAPKTKIGKIWAIK